VRRQINATFIHPLISS